MYTITSYIPAAFFRTVQLDLPIFMYLDYEGDSSLREIHSLSTFRQRDDSD